MSKAVEFGRRFWYDKTKWGCVALARMRFCAGILVLLLLLCSGCAKQTAVHISDATTTTTGSASAIVTVTTTAESTIVTVTTTAESTIFTDATDETSTTGSATGSSTAPHSTLGSSTTTSTKRTSTTTAVVTTTGKTTGKPSVSAPAISGELRGAWVSYIELEELFKTCTTPAKAKAALDTMMSDLASYGINAVFFHVRANSDAYYSSSIFKAAASAKKLLAVGFDPLKYAVEAAHKRGMQLHAWVNPYRAGKQTAYLVAGIPTFTDTAGRYYYVPTSAAAQKLILDGVRELLNNYAVDGIQYDDYFYPSGVLGKNTVYSFESADYEAYKTAGGTLSVGDWRRAGVDNLIAGTHTLTSAKQKVFGVSPAINAENTYTALYADCRKWLAQAGYVDYLCPQIYTGFEHSTQPFNKAVDTWQGYKRHSSVSLYFGVALYKIGSYTDAYAGVGKTEWKTHNDIMKRSVQYLRSKRVLGIAFYSYSFFKPGEKAGLSSTADIKVAQAEIRNLLAIL